MSNNKKTNSFKLMIGLFFVLSVILPIIIMIISIGDVDILRLLKSTQFIEALKNSLSTTITASIISVSLAFLLSVSILRTNIKHKNIFFVLLTLPMLIPSISHGMGLIILFGANGVITNLFSLSSNIYGFWGNCDRISNVFLSACLFNDK